MRTLTRVELTAALAARQLLLTRKRLTPAAAIARLTPLQGSVVKTTIMRQTLHLAAGAEYPAYAELSRQARLRTWRRTYPHLDEAQVVAELGAWLRTPRTNAEIRERVRRYDGVSADEWTAVIFARTLLPLVQVAPAGFWRERGRPSFAVDPRPPPDATDAATLVLRRYLAAFGPGSRRDLAAWAGVAQRDFAGALERLTLVSYCDRQGVELLDLPRRPLPPASTRLPVRLLSRWDQALLAYADRERIIPLDVQPLKLTLSGDATVTVGGRVAASWRLNRRGSAVEVSITPHVDIARAAVAEIRAEAERTARFCEPEATSVSVAGV